MKDPFRAEIASKFKQAISDRRLSKRRAAEELEVSRQMLYRYLNSDATPNSRILGRACRKWGLSLTRGGLKFGELAFPESGEKRPKSNTPEQIPLFAAIGALTDQHLEVQISDTGKNSLELKVRIKFAQLTRGGSLIETRRESAATKSSTAKLKHRQKSR